MAFIATEELRAAILNARASALNAKVKSMEAMNTERLANDYALAYDEEAFVDAIEEYGLHENDIILLTCHGETA